MELAIIDASVAAKWILTEPQTGVALDLLRQPLRCRAPSIILIEVAGAVVRRFRSGQLSAEESHAACEDWRALADDLFERIIPCDELYDTAIQLALKIRHPLADCLYLAAAMQLDCPLITADQLLHERGRRVHDGVMLLAKAI